MRARDLTRWLILLTLGLVAREARSQTLFDAPAVNIEHWAYFDEPHVVIPLSPRDGVTLTPESGARTVRVRVGDEQRPALLQAFKAKIVAPSTLDIQVDVKSLPLPATYAVAVEVNGTVGKPGTSQTQIVELTWTLPAGKLAPITPIVARDQLLWPGTHTAFRLFLREASGKAKLSNITLSEPDPPVNDGVPDERLDLSKVDSRSLQELSPGAEQQVVIPRPSSFSIGTTTGKITIRAPQLAEPMVVPYEVRTRVHDWVIIPLFLLMGLIGWAVRKYLKDREAIAIMRTELEPLAEQAETLIRTDPSAEPALRQPLQDARDALAAGEPVVARAKLDALRDAAAAALKARSDAIAALAQEVLPLKQAVNQSLDLPAKVDLQPARGALAAAAEALSNQDLAAAVSAHDRAIEALDAAGEKIRQWTNAAREELASLATTGLPKSAREAAQALAADETLKQLPVYDKAKRPEWSSYLRDVHEARFHLVQLVERVASAFARDAAEAVAVVRAARAQGAKPEDADALAQAGTLDAGALAKKDPVEALKVLRATIDAFKQVVQERVKSAEARALLAAGDYAGAIIKQVSIDTAQDFTPQIAGGGERAAALMAMPAAAARAPAPAPVHETVILQQPAAAIAVARADLARVQGWRAAVSALILSIAAWVVYRGAWIGTLNDFVGVATAAFFTDFTLDAVLDAVGKIRKS